MYKNLVLSTIVIGAVVGIWLLKKSAEFDPWIYDSDKDDYINQSEVLKAINDWKQGKLTREQVDTIVIMWKNNIKRGEMIPIPTPEPEPEPEPQYDKFYISSMKASVVGDDPTIRNCLFEATIINNGNKIGTHNITYNGSYSGDPNHRQGTISITLNPGESYIWKQSQFINPSMISWYKFTLQGDWIGDNYSSGVAQV